MTRAGKIFLAILLVIYGVQLTCKFAHLVVPRWFSSYLADLLCMPVLLILTTISIRWIKGWVTFLLSGKMILFTLIYLSLVFELLLPQLSARYTADPFDLVAYGVGALLFYLLQSRIFIVAPTSASQ